MAEIKSQKLADKAGSRVIHITIDLILTPPQTELGSTDAANAIGHGIIREVLQLLRVVGETEGFKVDIETRQVVF